MSLSKFKQANVDLNSISANEINEAINKFGKLKGGKVPRRRTRLAETMRPNIHFPRNVFWRLNIQYNKKIDWKSKN